jgi:hypothetical protein
VPQHEIVEEGPLLDEAGQLRVSGWARRPLLSYDRSAIAAPLGRIKERDAYSVFTKDFAVTFSVADNGYAGIVSASVLDFVGRRHSTEAYVVPFPLGSFALPASSEKGDLRIRHKKGSLDFAVMSGLSRIVKVDFPDFDHGSGLRGALVLTETSGAESIVTATPFGKKKEAFSYSRMSPCFSAEGVMQYGDEELLFPKGESFAVLDWSRGVRPYRDTWVRGVASGLVNGKQFAFNIGYGSGDSSSGTENAIFLDGVLHKLGSVTFEINPRDHLKTWRFTSDDGRLEMVMEPTLDRQTSTRALVYSSVQHTVFGRFSGRAILDDGSAVDFSAITGFAKQVKKRW